MGSMAKNKPQRHRQNLDLRSGQPRRFIVFSFRFLDPNQGESFLEWQSMGLLAKAMNKIRAISTMSIEEAFSGKVITAYNEFPPHSEFNHPKHVPEGVRWASMHIQGKEVIIGFIEENIFNIVFLDKEHRFWPTDKKHT
jgi:hypothetical protein